MAAAKKTTASKHESYRLATLNDQAGVVCSCGDQSPWLNSSTAAVDWWNNHAGPAAVTTDIEDDEE